MRRCQCRDRAQFSIAVWHPAWQASERSAKSKHILRRIATTATSNEKKLPLARDSGAQQRVYGVSDFRRKFWPRCDNLGQFRTDLGGI